MRQSEHVYGSHPLLSIGSLFVDTGSILIQAAALRLGAHYEVPASAFTWRSADGVFSVINETAASGGGLVPSGLGQGTTITRFGNSDPLPTNIFIVDTGVS